MKPGLSGHKSPATLSLSFSSEGFPGASDGKESACNAGGASSIPGLGRSPGVGNGYPLQYSCLEHPIDRGAWRVTESDTSEGRTLCVCVCVCAQLGPTLCYPLDYIACQPPLSMGFSRQELIFKMGVVNPSGVDEKIK